MYTLKFSTRTGIGGCPTLVCPFVGIYKRTLLRSSSLLLHQLPACLVRLVCFLRWEASNPTDIVSCGIASRLVSRWCSHTAAWKNSGFILSERQYFQMTNNLPLAAHAFPIPMLTSLAVDEILLPRYVNWFTNFKSLSFDVEMP